MSDIKEMENGNNQQTYSISARFDNYYPDGDGNDSIAGISGPMLYEDI